LSPDGATQMHRSGLSRNLVDLQQNESFFDGGFVTFIGHELEKR
jgi:hypothetical protein